jgi:HTH-type transcriptional regulator, cell division transcriptional repressor
MTDSAQTMGQRIRARRKELKLTQKQLGKKVNKTESAVSQWESDTHAPAGPHLGALCVALRTSPQWILTGEEAAIDLNAIADLIGEDASMLHRLFSQLRPENKRAVMALAEVLLENQPQNNLE